MNSNTDLTLFWLAWQKTCSIRLCCAGHEREYVEKCSTNRELTDTMGHVQALASDVINSMNRRFCMLLGKDVGMRLSDFSSEAEKWGHQGLGSAFELLESYLYNKQFLNGKPFKAYLFEDAAGRPGGMNKNLFGYLQRIMATMIHESYGENVYQPSTDEDGREVEPAQVSLDGRNVREAPYSPNECAEEHEVEESFRRYLIEHGASWNPDHWLILFCILNLLRVGSEKVRPLFSKGHQTINVWFSQMRSELLAWLRKNFSDKAIGMALNGKLQSILDDNVRQMAWYCEIRNILEESRKSTGK